MNLDPMTESSRFPSSVVEGHLSFVNTLSQKPKGETKSHIQRKKGIEKVWAVLKYGQTAWDGEMALEGVVKLGRSQPMGLLLLCTLYASQRGRIQLHPPQQQAVLALSSRGRTFS